MNTQETSNYRLKPIEQERIKIGFKLLGDIPPIEKIKLLLNPEDLEQLKQSCAGRLEVYKDTTHCTSFFDRISWGTSKKGYVYWEAMYWLFYELEQNR